MNLVSRYTYSKHRDDDIAVYNLQLLQCFILNVCVYFHWLQQLIWKENTNGWQIERECDFSREEETYREFT